MASYFLFPFLVRSFHLYNEALQKPITYPKFLGDALPIKSILIILRFQRKHSLSRNKIDDAIPTQLRPLINTRWSQQRVSQKLTQERNSIKRHDEWDMEVSASEILPRIGCMCSEGSSMGRDLSNSTAERIGASCYFSPRTFKSTCLAYFRPNTIKETFPPCKIE